MGGERADRGRLGKDRSACQRPPYEAVPTIRKDALPAGLVSRSPIRRSPFQLQFVETNAGGRAAFALTPELLIEEFHDHHHTDISTMFDHDSLAISSGQLTEVVRDIPA